MYRRAPRLPDTCYAGRVRCFFTICTAGRVPFFVDATVAGRAVAQLRQLATGADIAVVAWCLMPDHAHLLLEGRSSTGRPLVFVSQWKQQVGYDFRQTHPEALWQESFYDRVLREWEDSIKVAAYVLANPIRAGLSDRIGAYPYAGSEVYTTEALMDAFQVIGNCV